jgi:hypothetical protein
MSRTTWRDGENPVGIAGHQNIIQIFDEFTNHSGENERYVRFLRYHRSIVIIYGVQGTEYQARFEQHLNGKVLAARNRAMGRKNHGKTGAKLQMMMSWESTSNRGRFPDDSEESWNVGNIFESECIRLRLGSRSGYRSLPNNYLMNHVGNPSSVSISEDESVFATGCSSVTQSSVVLDWSTHMFRIA